MAKVGEIVIDALEDLVVQSDEAPIEQSEARAAIRVLNDLMLAWAAQGLSMGYTVVADMADILTVPDGAIRGIKANLALELAPKYDVAITPAMTYRAKEGLKAIRELCIEIAPLEYPSTLPVGSGNDWGTDFYPESDETALTETGGSIALEDDT